MYDQTVSAASNISYHYIPQIETALKDKDLDSAERLLQDAWELVAPGSPELARLQILRNDAQKQRQAKVTELEDAIRKALAVEPMDVATAEEKLDELERFQPKHPSLAGWRGSLASERTRRRADVKCKEVETELKRLWAEAEKAEQTGLYGQALLTLYLNAREYARREAANLKDPRLAGLAQRAEDTHNRVRRAHRETTTRQQEGQYKELLEQLRQMAPTDRVTISRDLIDLEGSKDYLLASEAVRLVEAQARDYAAQKAVGYRESALRSLEEHAPTTAEQDLSKALVLFGLDEEEKRRTDSLLKDRVMPAVERRSLAENKLKQADNQDAVRAWHLFAEARIADPYTPALAEKRESLLKRVIPYLNARIAEARGYLAKTGRPEWAKAQAVAKAARELAEQDTAFQAQMEAADAILTEAEGWRQLEADIKAAITEANAKREQYPTGAYDGLFARGQGWGENAGRFAELSETLAQLEARVRATEQLARFGDKVRSGSIDDVEQALKACLQAAGVKGARQTDLEKMAGRLRMHLSYLRGVALLRKADRSVEDARAGLELLREPVDGAGDDAEAARQLASTVKEDRAREEQAAAALKQGVAQLQAGQYADAYRVLKSYSGRREAAEAFLKATQGWEQQLIGQIKAALAGAERVDEKAFKQWVADLEALGSAHVTELKPRVYGRCAAQRARQLMLMPQRAGLADEIMRAWDEAVQEDPNNPDYQNERMSYDKRRTSFGLPQKPPLEQIQMLEDLAEKYPTDLDAKLWLADALIKHIVTLKGYEEVESQARQAQGVIAQAQQLAQVSDLLSRYQKVLADKSRTVEMHLDIALRSGEIERQLQADRLPDVWRKAREQATGLLKNYPAQRELPLWWRRVSQAALAGAQERLAARTNVGDIWEKIHPAGQIVVLDPENVTAVQQLGLANQAIVQLDSRQTLLEGDKTGASYAGDSAKAVEAQLTEANDIQKKLGLAEQVLMNFGGLFQESDKLREQVKAIRARNEQALDRVQRLNQYVNNARQALNAAKASAESNAWYAFDENMKLINEMGYGQHRTVAELQEAKQQVQAKQKHLRTLRTSLEMAVKNGNPVEALRLAEQMTGRPLVGNVTISAPSTAQMDPLADPGDQFGEQGRIRLQEPYTKRQIYGLTGLVNLLNEQLQQVNQLLAWLPSLPLNPQPNQPLEEVQMRVQRPITVWAQIMPVVEPILKAGNFDQARTMIDEVIAGMDGSQYRNALALKPAHELLSRPPVGEADLKSSQAAYLWQFGRHLLDKVTADLEAAQRQRTDVDRLESAWATTYQQFMNSLEDVRDRQESTNVLVRLTPAWRAAQRELKEQAREALYACEQLCPDHPDLIGWADDPLLG